MERLVLAGLCLVLGILLGLYAPACLPMLAQLQQAQQSFTNNNNNSPQRPPAFSLFPTPVPPLIVPRPASQQNQTLPATITPPAPAPTPVPPPTRSFTIPLQDGGEMTVNATDHAAAINNVKSTGATPAEP